MSTSLKERPVQSVRVLQPVPPAPEMPTEPATPKKARVPRSVSGLALVVAVVLLAATTVFLGVQLNHANARVAALRTSVRTTQSTLTRVQQERAALDGQLSSANGTVAVCQQAVASMRQMIVLEAQGAGDYLKALSGGVFGAIAYVVEGNAKMKQASGMVNSARAQADQCQSPTAGGTQ